VTKPKEVFYVEQRGAKLRYGQRGGGLFARLAGALGRAELMRHQGADAKVYRATVVWEEVIELDQ